MASLLGNTFALVMVQGVNFLTPLLVLPYLVEGLGVKKFGEMIFIQSIMAVGLLFVEFGFGWSITKKISLLRTDQNEISKIYSCGLSAQLLLALIFLFLVILARIIFAWECSLESFLLAYGVVFGVALLPIWLFQGLELIVPLAIIQILSKLSIFPILLYIKNMVVELTVNDALICFLIPSALTALISLAYIKSKKIALLKIPSAGNVYHLIVDSVPIFLSRLLISFYTLIVPIILGAVAGPKQLAYFNIAERVKISVQALLAPVSQAVFPRVNLLYKENPAIANKLISNILCFTGIFIFCVSGCVFFLSSEIVNFFGGGELSAAIEPLRILAFAPFVIVFSNVIGMQILVPKGLNKLFLKILSLGSILTLIFIYPLASNYGAVGVSFLVLLTEAVISLLMIKFFLKFKF
jgi:O-antigen/teichoic acid export membrane protein